MKNEVEKKVIQIMELSMKLNTTATQKEYTGSKPTVFSNFLGHVCYLEVAIHLNGWDFEPNSKFYDDSTTEYSLIDLDRETAYEELEAVCNRLKELCEKEGITIE